MPLSKDLSSFPTQEYMTILTKASRDGQLTINMETREDCARSRHEIYHVQKLIRESQELCFVEPYRSFVAQLADRPVTISVVGTSLVFKGKSTSLVSFARELLQEEPGLIQAPEAKAPSAAPALTQYGLGE